MDSVKKFVTPTIKSTLKEHLMYKLGQVLKMAAFVAIGFLAVHWLTAGQDNIINGTTPEQRDQQVMDIREHAPNSPAGVLSAHEDDCWTSEQQPKAELPGAAIVQFKDGRTIYTKKHVLVDAAFNEALASIGFGDKTSDKIDVIALCK
jgi:hypothetical protein